MNSLAKTDFFDDLFDHFFTVPTSVTRDYTLESTDGGYNVTLEMPGFTKDNLEIEVVGNLLQVSAKGGRGVKKTISKAWALPQDTNKDDIKAELIDGLLILKVARAGPQKILVPVQ